MRVGKGTWDGPSALKNIEGVFPGASAPGWYGGAPLALGNWASGIPRADGGGIAGKIQMGRIGLIGRMVVGAKRQRSGRTYAVAGAMADKPGRYRAELRREASRSAVVLHRFSPAHARIPAWSIAPWSPRPKDWVFAGDTGVIRRFLGWQRGLDDRTVVGPKRQRTGRTPGRFARFGPRE